MHKTKYENDQYDIYVRRIRARLDYRHWDNRQHKMRIEFCQKVADGPTEIPGKNMKRNESVKTMLG
jgi:hypothetical protein